MFFIINQTKTHKGKRNNTRTVPAKARPAIIQEDDQTAIEELLRLSNKHPNSKFVLYEAKFAAVRGVVQDPDELFPKPEPHEVIGTGG